MARLNLPTGQIASSLGECPEGLLTFPAGVALGPMGSPCKARRRRLAGCQARSRNAAMGAQWPEPWGLRPNGPATALHSLPRGLAIGGVARLVADPFGRNAIPRRECQQTLAKTRIRDPAVPIIPSDRKSTRLNSSH